MSIGCDEESWIADELWRLRTRLPYEQFVALVVTLLRSAQRDGRGSLRPHHRQREEGR